MRSRAIGSPLLSPLVFSAMLINAVWLSEMTMAHPSTPTSTDTTPSVVLRRATTSTTSRRPTVTVTGTPTATVTTPADNSTKKGLSLVVIIVIVVAVLVIFLLIVGFAYWCYRSRSKSRRKNKPLNLQSSRPKSGTARQEPDWWRPTTEGAATIDSHDHTIVPYDLRYDLGGHGYTYGRTLDVPSPTAVTGNRSSVGYAPQLIEQDPARPFQNPVLASPHQPPISPTYHTYAGQDERTVPHPRELDTIRSGRVYNPEPYTPPIAHPLPPLPPPPPPPPPPPSGGFHPRDTSLTYLEPQVTGTSIYSNPYEITAMTRSTAGHAGT